MNETEEQRAKYKQKHNFTRGSHREVSAAVRSVFVCKYDNGNFNGDCITNLFLSPRIDRIRSIEKQK